MPAVGFVYPDGLKVSFEEIREGNVDIEKMGMTLPTLIEMSKERDPNRKEDKRVLYQSSRESIFISRDYASREIRTT